MHAIFDYKKNGNRAAWEENMIHASDGQRTPFFKVVDESGEVFTNFNSRRLCSLKPIICDWD